MPLKSRVCSSQRNLVLFILLVTVLAAGPALAAPTSVTLTAPSSQTGTCQGNDPAPCVTLIHGQSVQFTATVIGTGTFNPAIVWTYSPTLGTLNTGTGLYTAPASLFQNFTIKVTASSLQDPSKFSTATVYLVPTVGTTISPTTANLSDGQQQQFTATVTGTSNTAVTWSSTPQGVGSVDNTGLYTAPPVVTGRQTVTVTAVSVADPIQAATATITLIPSSQIGVTVSPRNVTIRNGGDTQQFGATVVGLASTAVTWSISPQVGTILSTGLYIAPNTISSNQTITVTATSTANPAFSGSTTLTLTPAAIVVTPSGVTLGTNQTQQYAATINGQPFTDVNWSLSAAFGSISAAGLYKAPSFAPIRLVIQIIATSNSDPTYFGTTNVTITQSVATISPASVSLSNGDKQVFTFNIDGVPDPNPALDVIWSLSSAVGKIAADGTYTAPNPISTGGTVTLTGTYIADATKTAKATINLTVLVDVGHGAPNSAIQQLFITNFNRGRFYPDLVSLPPLGDVKRLGTTGYVQEFPDANKTSGVKYALVMPNPPNATTPTPPVYQLNGDVYGYYSSVGVTTAGYPTADSQTCPFFDQNNSCTYDIFDKGVALFVYKAPVFAAQTQFTISGVFYTKWNALGGIAGGPGRPVDAAVAVTSSSKVTSNVQTYAGGAIYQITSGANNNQVFAVLGPIYNLYQAQGGPTAYLGLPTANEVVQTNGDHRQTFEGGALQYTPGSDPVVRLPVATVQLSSTGTLKMNAGDTVTVRASALTTTGAVLSDRTVTWSTTNGQVVVIAQTTAGGSSATIKAIGAGTASIRASADGIVSLPLTVAVTAQCCQVGEGAPTTVISQAFQSAVTRNHLNVALPAGSAVQRQGHGYVQQLQDATSGSKVNYLVTKSDNAANAYVVSGAILARYQQLGGVTGSLGFPIADATAGGTQTFENSAALSGNPAMLVSGAIFTKWSTMATDAGAAGPPAGEAAAFSTIGANAGSMQAFKNGVIYAASSGPRSGQAYFVSGLILARYNAIGGPGGNFGMPVTDEFVSGATHRQNFEGGYIDFNVGDAVAQAHAATQKPAVSAPQSVLAGSRLHLAITGFQAGAAIRVSITGQSDFTVTTANGAYAWDVYVPLTARASTNTIHAADVNGSDTADAVYNVLSLANNRAQFTKMLGDVQTSVPGALVPQPLQVALRDQSGNPVIGATVVFQASPGAQLIQPSAVTDQNGLAQTGLRLPPSEGLAAVTVDSPGIAASPVTFFVTASSSSLGSFPKQVQSLTAALGNGTATIAQKGALLTATASIVRYFQNRGDLQAPNGLADPGVLNQFLKSFCVADASGRQICDGFVVNPDAGEQVVNLWRANEFVGGNLDVSVEKAELNSVRDLIALGSPVLLSLSLSGDGNAAGGHTVVAIGVGAGGEILIQDPNPNLAQPQLDNYLNGFVAAGHTWTAQLQSAVRLVPRVPAGTRFLLAAVSQPPALVQNLTLEARSIAGACGLPVDLTDAADVTGLLPAAPPRVSRFVSCDGSQPLYQINIGASQAYRASLTDFAKGGTATDLSAASPSSYKASRPAQVLALAPQDLTLLADGVVNGASFTAGIAPGGIFTIFGSGLAGVGVNTSVAINGVAVQVLVATPFQINAVIPQDLAPGSYSLQVQSPFGLASQDMQVVANAPAIFLLGSQTQGAVVNQGGSLNSSLNPAVRSQGVTIYATGLGTVTRQGNLSEVTTAVSAVLAGVELRPSFAGLAPGFVGLYQVNVPIPAATPPGLDLPLLLRQGGVDGNTVNLSVQ